MTPLLVLLGPLLASPSPSPTASISIVTPPPVDKTGVGGLGFLIVMALLAASVGLFFAMRGSLRRLQGREIDGTFGGSSRKESTAVPPDA